MATVEIREGGVLMGYAKAPDTPKITPREAVGEPRSAFEEQTGIPLASPARADTWTRQNEEMFVEMQERRERVRKLRLTYLETAMAGAQEIRVGPQYHDALLAYMVTNAGAIRDALAPYDNRS